MGLAGSGAGGVVCSHGDRETGDSCSGSTSRRRGRRRRGGAYRGKREAVDYPAGSQEPRTIARDHGSATRRTSGFGSGATADAAAEEAASATTGRGPVPARAVAQWSMTSRKPMRPGQGENGEEESGARAEDG